MEKGGAVKTQNIARELARFTCGITFEQLPKEVVERTKLIILDALAGVIAGRDSIHAKIIQKLLKDSKGSSTIFTFGSKVSISDATYANSVLITSTGFDDFAASFKSHPQAIVIPPAIAAAEQGNGSGADVVTAVVLGYEMMGRVFLGGPITPRFRVQTVLGPFGAGAAAGKLFKLNEDQLTHTLGYAANFSSGYSEVWETGMLERKYTDAMASRLGIDSALLARAGATASESTMEGRWGYYNAFSGKSEVSSVATVSPAARADLGKRFFIMDAVCKLYPCSATSQINCYLAQKLLKQNNIKGEDIDKAVMTVSDERLTRPGWPNAGPFLSRQGAVVSSRFNTAAAFLGRPVESYTYYDNYNDPEVLELAKKIELVGIAGRTQTKIEVTLHNGKQYSIEGALGDLLVPTTEKTVKKFNTLASTYKGKDRIRDLVLNLDKINNIRELTKALS